MATSSVIPDLIDALIAACQTALPDVLVVDGPGADQEDVEDFLHIGMRDPRNPAGAAATETQEWPKVTTHSRAGSGSIFCAAVSWDGSGVQKTARDQAFATVAAVQELLHADPHLGVDGVVKTSYTSIDFDQGQTSAGAFAVVLFAVEFDERLVKESA